MVDSISEFEDRIAEWYGAKHGIATDSCTHALELCLRLKDVAVSNCPAHTYLSVPMTMHKLNMLWSFTDESWTESYLLGGTNIRDAAVQWRQGSHIAGEYTCLSFQFKKHLSLGRGGMILCDHAADALTLRKMSYDGRLPGTPWADQQIDTWGYHYYMTPEMAELGLLRLPAAMRMSARTWDWRDYPDLRHMEVFGS